MIFGNVQQTSADAIYLARHVGLRAGVPVRGAGADREPPVRLGLPGDRQRRASRSCSARREVVLAGGTENMSQAPHVVRGARWGLPLGKAPALEDSLWAALTDRYTGMPMAITAENLAEKYEHLARRSATRTRCARSRRWAAAQEAGRFKRRDRAGRARRARRAPSSSSATSTRAPRRRSEVLAKLPPVFKKDGVVTAGNASGICDGAAALVLASREAGREAAGSSRSAASSAGASPACDPKIMGIGPAPAIRQRARARRAQARATSTSFEVNEAFAPQYLAVEKELGLAREKTNVNGGAIALGHPLGASGARITAHLVYELAPPRRPATASARPASAAARASRSSSRRV